MVRRHGRWPKHVVPPRSHNVESGKFGRMFINLPPFADDTPAVRAALLEVGKLKGVMDAKDKLSADPVQLITDPALSANNPNNPKMTAGMTFLGQFIDHDISFDTTSSLERQTDPQQITNFRVPTLALDSVYGIGPLGSPHLYDQSPSGQGIKFLTEPTGTPNKFDVPRNSQMVALIADPRNDENLIVSQLHLAFLRFHNNVVDHVKNNTGLADPEDVFTEAQRVVRWHYQWILVHEFLELTCGATVVNEVLANGRKFYRFKTEPFIPVEFSVAAYRFGHSQVRPS
jgi:Animal haem peroxidase